MVHPHHERYSGIKKKDLLIHSITDGSQGLKQSEKKLLLKGHILYDSICITFSILQNYRDGEQISGGQRSTEGGGGGSDSKGGHQEETVVMTDSIQMEEVTTQICTCDKMAQTYTQTLHQGQIPPLPLNYNYVTTAGGNWVKGA